jgi:putative hydrolase of the HAD superfamily
MLDVIAFDGDDTLWSNEPRYTQGKETLKQLLSGYLSPQAVGHRLDQVEVDNIRYWGYGIKSFVLSMIETAIELTGGRISGSEIREVLAIGKRMLGARVELFEGVESVLAGLAREHALMLVTKGDLFEQELKVGRSGLAGYFRHVEVVGEKSAESYRALLEKYGVQPAGFLMVGNSLRSDILPVLEIGGRAVYIPYANTWSHEHVEAPPLHRPGFYELERIDQLEDLIRKLDQP